MKFFPPISLRAVFCATLLVAAAGCSRHAHVVASGELGAYLSPGGYCFAVLRSAGMGRFMQLFVQPDTSMSQHVADDVTGVVWVDDQALVFSTSAIHGRVGGVFRYTCARKDAALEAVLLPEDYNGTNAQGHFELDEFKDGSLFYYHLPNAEELGDKPFPTKEYLRKLDLGKDLEDVDPQTLKTVGHDCDLHHPFIP